MMNQEKWNRLKEVFNDDMLFNENSWADAYEIDGIDLENWLECDSRSPSYRMIHDFSKHGYKVYATEQDSFGWLGGSVKDKQSGRELLFG